LTPTLGTVDVAIGLTVLYLVLSLLCSSVNEGFESFRKNRSRQLERGIREILSDPDGTSITQLLYKHPLITGLFQGSYDPAHLRPARILTGKFYGKRNLPSYIPAANFALAVLDIVLPGTETSPGGAAATLASPGTDAERELAASLRQAALSFPVPEVGRALVLLIDASSHDLARVRGAIEFWFNSTMDRVSGWYKRRTQFILFLVGLTIAISLNVDSVEIANHLAADPALRSSLTAIAEQYAQDPAIRAQAQGSSSGGTIEGTLNRLTDLGLPLGWKHAPTTAYQWFLKVAGLLATTLAATLGAPFWFDILNRFVVIRSTIKPREKSSEEKSKD
jgi:hypothetical protein